MNEIGNIIKCLDEDFEIKKLLGKGKGGYSYLAESKTRKVVIKYMHYEPCDTYTFEHNKLASELRDYETLKTIGIAMPKLLYFDKEKQFLVKDYIDGDTVSQIVADGNLKDSYVIQMFEMCKLLYEKNINIDYFPPNFVVENEKMYYIDYECNGYMEQWDFENWGIYFWANTKGMKHMLDTGSHDLLSENAIPHKNGLEDIVDRLLKLKNHIS